MRVFHRRVTVLLVAWGLVLAACGGADPGDPAGATTSTVAPAGAQGDSGGDDDVDPDPGVTDEEVAPDPGADPLDIDLMAPTELPDGIPVPVPAGGVPDGLTALEGETFSLEFPPGSLERIGAFYDVWFADQGIEVEPTFGSDELQLWRVNVNGVPVEIQLYALTNADGERLLITWP